MFVQQSSQEEEPIVDSSMLREFIVSCLNDEGSLERICGIDLCQIGACTSSGSFNSSLTGGRWKSVGIVGKGEHKVEEAYIVDSRIIKLESHKENGGVAQRKILELDIEYGSSLGEKAKHTVIFDPEMKDKQGDFFSKSGRGNYLVRRTREAIGVAYANGESLNLKCIDYNGDSNLIKIGGCDSKGILSRSLTGGKPRSLGLPHKIKFEEIFISNSRIVDVEFYQEKLGVAQKKVLELDIEYIGSLGEKGRCVVIYDPAIEDEKGGFFLKNGQNNYLALRVREAIKEACKKGIPLDLGCIEYDGINNLVEIGVCAPQGIFNSSLTEKKQKSVGLPNRIECKEIVISNSRGVELKVYQEDGSISSRKVLELDLEYVGSLGEKGTHVIVYDPEIKDKKGDFFSKSGKDNYLVLRVREAIKVAYKSGKALELDCINYNGTGNLVEMGVLSSKGLLNASFTGNKVRAVGFLQNIDIEKACIVNSRTVALESYQKDGSFFSRKVLELDIEYEGNSGSHYKHTVVYDPEIKDEKVDFFSKKGEGNYLVVRAQQAINVAHKQRVPVNLKCIEYAGTSDLLEIGAFNSNGQLSTSFTEGEVRYVGLPRDMNRSQIIQSRIVRAGNKTFLELSVLCIRNSNTRSIKYINYDGREFSKPELEQNISQLKGALLDLYLYHYIRRNNEQALYQARREVLELTGECREPNILLPGNNWIHAKWGSFSDSVQYFLKLNRAAEVLNLEAPLLLIYRKDTYADILKFIKNFEKLSGKKSLLRVKLLEDWLMEVELIEEEANILSKIRNIESEEETDLKERKKDLEAIANREVTNIKGQASLEVRGRWKDDLEGLIQNEANLVKQLKKIERSHSLYYEKEYHFHLVARLAFVMMHVGEGNEEIRDIIFNLYPDMEGENYEEVITLMINASLGLKEENLDGDLENLNKAYFKPKRFSLSEYLSGPKKTLSTANKVAVSGFYELTNKVSGILIEKDGISKYLQEVLRVLKTVDHSDMLEAKFSVISRLNSYFKDHKDSKLRERYDKFLIKEKEARIRLGEEEEDLIDLLLDYEGMSIFFESLKEGRSLRSTLLDIYNYSV